MKKLTIILFTATLIISSCKKSYIDVNQNPNQPTQVTPNVVSSSALVGTAANIGTDYLGLARWMGYLSRSGNYVPDVQTETYNITNDYTDAEWTSLYLNLNNYNYIENVAKEQNLPFYIGVAKAMKAYDFSILVDMYNNIPYSEAFNVTENTTPAYEDGQTVYTDLVNQLDSAYDYFESAKTYYSGAASTIVTTDDQYDVMFGSARTGKDDPTDRMILWQKFTNTLKLRLLLNQSQVASQQGFIQQEIAKITNPDPDNGTAFLDAGQSAAVNPGYQPSTGKQNPFYNLFITVTGNPTSTNNYYRANSYAVNFYVNTGDLRQYFVYSGYSLTPGSNFDGDPASVPNSSTSGIGDGLLKSPSQDQLIISDFESLFMQAEAAERGWIQGDPRTLYESAITQSYVYVWVPGTIEDLGVDPVDDKPEEWASFYLTGDIFGNGPTEDVNWDASPNKLQLILTQKWIALNGIDWVIAYDDYRRTGYPTNKWLSISHSPTHLQSKIPIRYLYPQVEFNTNGGNVPQLGNGAQFTANVFWDVQ